MKSFYIFLLAFVAINLSKSSAAFAQDGGAPAVNPFPISEERKTELIEKYQKESDSYLTKYSDHNLATWPEADRNAYMKAKALKIILMFATDYYRDSYPKLEITKDKKEKVGKFVPSGTYYNLLFYYDPTKEDLGTRNNKMIKVSIWEENAQAQGFIIQSINWGDFFMSPTWEDGLLEKWNKEGRKPYPYLKVEPIRLFNN